MQKKGSDGDRIKQLRESLGLRRTEFGAKFGYSHEQVQRLEEGRAALNDGLREKISEEYGVSAAWLNGDSDGQEPLAEDSASQRRMRMRMVYEESGLTQREFGKQTHTSTSMLSDVISGRKQLTIRYAKKVEEALGVGADWLLYGDERAKDYPFTDTMMKYIKTHPDIRKEIQESMKTDGMTEDNDM